MHRPRGIDNRLNSKHIRWRFDDGSIYQAMPRCACRILLATKQRRKLHLVCSQGYGRSSIGRRSGFGMESSCYCQNVVVHPGIHSRRLTCITILSTLSHGAKCSVYSPSLLSRGKGHVTTQTQDYATGAAGVTSET